jgi:hypothetical protein
VSPDTLTGDLFTYEILDDRFTWCVLREKALMVKFQERECKDHVEWKVIYKCKLATLTKMWIYFYDVTDDYFADACGFAEAVSLDPLSY